MSEATGRQGEAPTLMAPDTTCSTTGDAVTTSESDSTTQTNNITSISTSELSDSTTFKDSSTTTIELTDSTSAKDSATTTTSELLDSATTAGSEINVTDNTAEVTTTSQTTTAACFECDCALTVAGTSVSGERKFILSNNKFVLCILDAVQNHKWTVIQRRFLNGGQSFDKDWIDYENGFGTLTSEFWIGNQYIHELTSLYEHIHLRIEMVASSGHVGIAEYTFSVDDASQDYRLHTSNYVGNRGDPLTSTGSCTECADGMKFTTRDRDNDMQNLRNCATLSRGGWWHNACQRSNLNGQFGQSNYLYGLNWDGFMDIMSVEMKVRKP
ncbi:angiopoietin-related protein 7-like [Saccostrea cucullata]|uniref:angiopoietin-related protein 7-like n=1 Tax=Saccostrea cuccullata TaxID=36930 RepID=UPI002ECFD084